VCELAVDFGRVSRGTPIDYTFSAPFLASPLIQVGACSMVWTFMGFGVRWFPFVPPPLGGGGVFDKPSYVTGYVCVHLGSCHACTCLGVGKWVNLGTTWP
jgi:hypothetical protein